MPGNNSITRLNANENRIIMVVRQVQRAFGITQLGLHYPNMRANVPLLPSIGRVGDQQPVAKTGTS